MFSSDVILCGWLGSKHQLTNKLTRLYSDLLQGKRREPLLAPGFSVKVDPYFLHPPSFTAGTGEDSGGTCEWQLIWLKAGLVLLAYTSWDETVSLGTWTQRQSDWRLCRLAPASTAEFGLPTSVFARSRSGELLTEKLKSHLMRTQSWKVLPLKPGVGRYIVMYATLTARDFFLANFYPSYPFICIFSKTSPKLLDAGSCVDCPQNINGLKKKVTCGVMTCEMSNLEIEWSLCSALIWSFVDDWAQSTKSLTFVRFRGGGGGWGVGGDCMISCLIHWSLTLKDKDFRQERGLKICPC